MKTLSIREMRSELTHLDTLVASAGEIVITRRGKPVARLLPLVGSKPKPNHEGLRKRLPRQQVGSEVLISSERDER